MKPSLATLSTFACAKSNNKNRQQKLNTYIENCDHGIGESNVNSVVFFCSLLQGNGLLINVAGSTPCEIKWIKMQKNVNNSCLKFLFLEFLSCKNDFMGHKGGSEVGYGECGAKGTACARNLEKNIFY